MVERSSAGECAGAGALELRGAGAAPSGGAPSGEAPAGQRVDADGRPPREGGDITLGILVPCRNEAAVIGRKLANLARLRWPASSVGHRVVVVDDGSDDGTAERAREALAARGWPAAVRADVLQSDRRPGKAGAIAAGLAALGEEPDVIVLSDADVVLEEQALAALAAAFASDPRLVMACGAQRFVRDLASDGSIRGAGGGASVDAGTPYDRLTALVRRLESRRGALFSVHGQLLAWRRELQVAPRRQLAADDLELMLAARAARPGGRIELVEEARFLEVKTAPGPDAASQALRRARAYVQLMREHPAPAGGQFARVQWLLYRRAPLAFPGLLVGLPALVIAGLAAVAGWHAAWIGALGVGCALLTPPGRQAVAIARTIRRASRIEARERLSDRWEMTR